MDWLHKILTDKEVLKQGLENYVTFQMKKYEPLLDDLERVKKELARRKAAKEKLLDVYLDGVFDKETIQLRKLQLDEDIKSAISAKADLDQQPSEISSINGRVRRPTF